MPPGVELIAARTELAELERRVSKYLDTTRLLEQPLRQARKRFDYIILDTPPAARSIATISAYSEAEWILLSAFPHHLSVEGLAEAFRDINDVRRYRNHKLEVLGILLCCVDRRVRKTRKKVEELIATAIPGREFSTTISQATVLPESSSMGTTLFQRPDASGHPVADQYRELAAEVEHRVSNRHAFLSGRLALLDHTDTASVEVITLQDANGPVRLQAGENGAIMPKEPNRRA
jgi:chromosome partitioning protein